jgi:hypothetical protein
MATTHRELDFTAFGDFLGLKTKLVQRRDEAVVVLALQPLQVSAQS